jgi:hypothetical protein
VSSLDGFTPLNYLSNPFPNGLDLPTGSKAGLLTVVGQTVGQNLDGVIDRGTRVAYMQQWNINIQRELAGRLSVEVAYTGSKGTKLVDQGYPLNQLRLDQLSLGSQLQALVPNPFYGFIKTGPLAQPTVVRSQLLKQYPQFIGLQYFRSGFASSIYHAMQLRLQKDGSSGEFVGNWRAQRRG